VSSYPPATQSSTNRLGCVVLSRTRQRADHTLRVLMAQNSNGTNPEAHRCIEQRKRIQTLCARSLIPRVPSYPARGDSAIASRSIFVHTLADRNESRQTARRATPGSMRGCPAIPGRKQQRPARGGKRSECRCRQRQSRCTVEDEEPLINCPNQTEPGRCSMKPRTVRSRYQDQ
jgi:hypothetical protein